MNEINDDDDDDDDDVERKMTREKILVLLYQRVIHIAWWSGNGFWVAGIFVAKICMTQIILVLQRILALHCLLYAERLQERSTFAS